MKLDSFDYLSLGAAFLAVCAGVFIIWVGFQVMPTMGIFVSIGDFALGGINFLVAGLNIWFVKEKHKKEVKKNV